MSAHLPEGVDDHLGAHEGGRPPAVDYSAPDVGDGAQFGEVPSGGREVPTATQSCLTLDAVKARSTWSVERSSFVTPCRAHFHGAAQCVVRLATSRAGVGKDFSPEEAEGHWLSGGKEHNPCRRCVVQRLTD